MDIFGFSGQDILSFYLTLFRVSVVLFLLPFYGGKSIPATVKAALVLVLSFALWPSLSFPAEMMPAHPLDIAVMLAGEAALGMTLGLMVNLLFAAIQTGGQIIGFQMGFAMVNVMDPITGVTEAVTGHFLYMVTMLTFLALNGHLYLLSGLAESFELVPPGQLFFGPEVASQVFEFSNILLVLAVKLAAPIMVTLFLVDLALALISRAAPQMNVLIIGFPFKIAVGFFFLGFLFTILSTYVIDFIQGIVPMYINVMKALTVRATP